MKMHVLYLTGPLAVLLCLGCSSHRYEDGAMIVSKRRYPGTMVDVGGYRLFFSCSDSAARTVLLETGGGSVALGWKLVQDRLSAEQGSQVCSYDRAGLGWSDPYPGAYSIEQEVDALHRALEQLPTGEDLFLVGASYGGWMIRSYATKYPAKVQGLVYVEANTVYFFDRHPEVVQETEGSGVPFLAKIMPT